MKQISLNATPELCTSLCVGHSKKVKVVLKRRSAQPPSTTHQAGFTLIELMIALAVLVLVLSWAMPSLRGTIARNQLLGQASELAGALAIARSEAVTRGHQSGVCASDNGSTCGSAFDWDKQMLVFVDENNDSVFDPGSGDILLKVFSALPEVSRRADTAAIFFNREGFSTLVSQVSVELCHSVLSESNRCREVSIAPTGIVKVVTTTSSGG